MLANIAAEIGLDQAKVLAATKDQRFAQELCDAERSGLKQGIQGVSAVILNHCRVVNGAQGLENYSSILGQLAQLQD